MKYDNESFTLVAAGGAFRVTAETPFARRIAEVRYALFQREKQLQLVIGEQKPRVVMRALFLTECTLFRLPSRLEVALPQAPIDSTRLFELGINTLVFKAASSKKEASRLSWNEFYEKTASFREQGFKIALEIGAPASSEEIRALSSHFDFLYAEEVARPQTVSRELLAHEKIASEIRDLEEIGVPLFYVLKQGVKLHAKALFLLSFSVQADTCIAFEAVTDGVEHPFFAESASHAVRDNARLIPVFSGGREELLRRPLFGAAMKLPALPAPDSAAARALLTACNCMWRL